MPYILHPPVKNELQTPCFAGIFCIRFETKIIFIAVKIIFIMIQIIFITTKIIFAAL